MLKKLEMIILELDSRETSHTFRLKTAVFGSSGTTEMTECWRNWVQNFVLSLSSSYSGKVWALWLIQIVPFGLTGEGFTPWASLVMILSVLIAWRSTRLKVLFLGTMDSHTEFKTYSAWIGMWITKFSATFSEHFQQVVTNLILFVVLWAQMRSERVKIQ